MKLIEINNEKSYLGKRGYILKKENLTFDELEKLRNDLTVKPNVLNDFNKDVKSFKVYRENKKKIYIPKFYGIKYFGEPEVTKIPEGQDIDINFVFKLRENQKKPVEKAIENYKKYGGGILHLQTGFGKTIIACYFIAFFKKKTLVIVHKEFLLDQWVERINQSLPGSRIGFIQGNKFDIEDKDIVIVMLQTLWSKKFPLNAFHSFGHVIIDECHRIPSEKFSRALFKINSKYMLGLSATPTRKDGLTKLLKWHIGDIFYSMKFKSINDVDVERVILFSNDIDNYKKELVDFRGRVLMSTMINNICYFKIRTYAIIKFIVDVLNESIDRQILVLSDRKKQLTDIFNIVTENDYCSVGYYIGGMKDKQRKESEKKQLILGTYSMAKEGLDIKTLNCLFLVSPKSDIVQAVGRILRQKHNNINPKIVDFVDTFSVFNNQSKKRFNLFKKRKYSIKDIMLDIDNLKVLGTKEYNFKDKKSKKDNEKNTKEKPQLSFSKKF